ncbi:extracellular solute-binding protein [Sinosporangium album]|uniref:Extracellular solute-binding protein n=1 Tax=Sinosporangium album TaxID=504805 RepID=A0A1G8C1I8_9ACTN|nr:substrate-binding domain-containing protein [Sinosporangium album]SDH39228.1 extracellular solute-binding protein [Sinosporangium album]
MGRHRIDGVDDGGRPYEARSRRTVGPGRVLVPLAGAVALAVLAGVAAYVIFTRDRTCTGDDRLDLTVSASPDVQPAVTKVAAMFNRTGRVVEDRCVTVTVKQQSTAAVLSALRSGKAAPRVWIPDSSLQLSRLSGGSQKVPKATPVGSIAASPIVMVAARSAVPALRKAMGEPSWSGLIRAADVTDPAGAGRKVRALALDPHLNSAGLGALMAASASAGGSGVTDQRLIGALKRLASSTVRSPASMLSTVAVKARRVPLGVASEQSIWAYNKTAGNKVAPLYPSEGILSLDYPLIAISDDRAVVEAAREFHREFSSEAAKRIVRDQGFRTPDGRSGASLKPDDGFPADPPKSLPTPEADEVARLTQSWSRLNLGSRMLTLLDISGTMALPVEGTGSDRIGVITEITTEGMRLFSADTEIGVWEFSTDLNGAGRDYRELVSVGALAEPVNGVPRKDLLARRLRAIEAKPMGDTGLNDTLAAAYARMKAGYQPDKINTILVLTDGAGNDDPGGGLSNTEILQRLERGFDPDRPVNILLIAFGPDAAQGKRQMNALAKATGGEAFIVKDIRDVRGAFLKAMERRLCAPNCDG